MPLTGVLYFHSETGTEGGHWAFQHQEYMGLEQPNMLRCPRCGRVWNTDLQETEPRPGFTYWVDREGEVSEAGHRLSSGYQGFSEPQEGLPLAPPSDDQETSFNAMWTRRTNEAALVCYMEGHESWDLMYPEGSWSREGTHILKSGDKLRVLDPEDRTTVVWEGVVDLVFYRPFTESVHGLWIHSDQQGEDREDWAKRFINEYPAELDPA